MKVKVDQDLGVWTGHMYCTDQKPAPRTIGSSNELLRKENTR